MSAHVSRMRREDLPGHESLSPPPDDEDLARPTGIAAAIPYAVYKGVGVVKRHAQC